ncbi:hypothetical protein MLD38_030495 [Melastoma candidum]|uniref:Uncharacterized protein n=1 Tax=Melastoma candidum TaxID=119954 RepID=A0ACB9MND4_9MYRT|nr:hypothetical protein MLD38_030495 [Melastoma candidum]
MSSRVFVIVGILAAFLLLVSMEVAAGREMSGTAISERAATSKGEVGDDRGADVYPDQYGGYPGRGGGYGGYPGGGGGYPGGGGGYPGGGGGYGGRGGGYPGRCPYGRCCRRDYCRCCYYAGEAAEIHAEGKPLN